MMSITVLAVGQLKEKYWREAVSEYQKRLSRYCTLRITEVPDERAPEKLSDAEHRAVLEKEGFRILRAADPAAPLWALDIRGKRMDSEGFSRLVETAGVQGTAHVQFVIGGSLGLSPDLLQRAEKRISFSDMTFPHQLMRVILLEQLYRGFRIARGEPYHK